jgi:hypothetical protein
MINGHQLKEKGFYWTNFPGYSTICEVDVDEEDGSISIWLTGTDNMYVKKNVLDDQFIGPLSAPEGL